MEISYPQQGEIYLRKATKILGDTKIRPCVVVSTNIRNELSETVLVVPFTSDLENVESPTRILVLPTPENGLEKESLACCEQISTVLKPYLNESSVGKLDSEVFALIQQGIQIAIGVY